MRQIEFRAKEVDSKRWYYGSYLRQEKSTYCFKEDYDATPDNEQHFIVFDETVDWGLPNRHLRADILPETLGQFIGRKDRNGKKVFEGDIVIIDLPYKAYNAYVVWGDCGWDAVCIGIPSLRWHLASHYELEVVGNIHDNPKMLEV